MRKLGKDKKEKYGLFYTEKELKEVQKALDKKVKKEKEIKDKLDKIANDKADKEKIK